LPIQQLKFGKHPTFDLDYNYGKFTLGKLECSGRVKVTGIPTSCRDLYIIGHIFNDLYSIKKNGKVETVFCDFTLSPFDPSEVINKRQLLYFTAPVSGRFFLASSCSGKRVDYNIPKSCYELSIIGHSLNGLYSVMGAEEKKIEMVYCDFNLAPDDENWSTYFLFYFHFNLREKAKKKAWLCASQIRWIWRLFLCPTID